MSISVSKVQDDLKCFVLPQPQNIQFIVREEKWNQKRSWNRKMLSTHEVTSPSLPVFVVERSSSRRASEEGWKLAKRELGQPDWVCPHQRGLCCGPGQCLEVSLPLLQKWRRYAFQCWAHFDWSSSGWLYLCRPMACHIKYSLSTSST